MRKLHFGFTLIELIVTLILIGLLAVIAMPRFYDTAVASRVALIKAGAGAIRTAGHIVHLKVIANGLPNDATIRQVDLGDGTVVDVQYGYPACSNNGIVKATIISTEQYRWYVSSSASDYCTLYPNRGADSSGVVIFMPQCAVVYDVRAGTTWPPVVSGC